jgi:prepilin-type N-terminal cleavage/methylation domain-containing protein
MNNQRLNKGFSLIELLVAVTVLGIVLTIATPQYSGFLSSSKQLQAKSSLLSIQILLENYFSQNGRYCPETDCASSPYIYEENSTGTITEDALVNGFLATFRPKNFTTDTAVLYHFSVAVSGSDLNIYSIVATPVTDRGAPNGNLSINQEGLKTGW